MNVGIFWGKYVPTVGGGYTIGSDILQAVASFGAESGHTFVLYSLDREPPPEISSARHIRFVSLDPLFKQRLRSKFHETAVAAIRKLMHPRGQFTIEDWFEKGLLNILVADRIDIVWPLELGCMTKEVPYIATVYDLEHRSQPYFPELSATGRWRRREAFLFGEVLQRATYVITGTKTGKAEIERFYHVPADRIKILPHPTPKFALLAPDCDTKPLLDKYGIPKNYLFYPAQFWPHKNHVGLLFALRRLRDDHGLVLPLVFVGADKGNQHHVRLLSDSLGLSGQVYFLGFVPRSDLVALYRNALALTYVSFCGPENLPPLEAFALGCPVIASRFAGSEEQLGAAAMLVAPGDENQMALAIKSLYEDATLRQVLVQRGLARAVQWTGQEYVTAIFRLFDEFASIRRCWSNSELYRDV